MAEKDMLGRIVENRAGIRSFDGPSPSEIEMDAARDAQAAHLARFNGAPAPRVVPARVLDFLERQKADYAITRLRLETRMLDEVEVLTDALNARMFKFQEADQRIRVNLLATRERRDLGRDPGDTDPTVHERDLRDNADRQASAQQKLAFLQGKVRILNDRLKGCHRLVLGQGYAGSLTFLTPPIFNAKTTLRQVRDRISELKANLKDTEIAPLPAAVARELMVKWIDRTERAINARGLLERGENGGRIYIPRVLLPASGGGAVESEAAVGLIVWLMRDELIAKLGEQIDRAAARDEEAALAPEAWTKKVQTLKTEILETERVEESVVWEMLKAGKDVELRGDANPRAILAVSDGRA